MAERRTKMPDSINTNPTIVALQKAVAAIREADVKALISDPATVYTILRDLTPMAATSPSIWANADRLNQLRAKLLATGSDLFADVIAKIDPAVNVLTAIPVKPVMAIPTASTAVPNQPAQPPAEEPQTAIPAVSPVQPAAATPVKPKLPSTPVAAPAGPVTPKPATTPAAIASATPAKASAQASAAATAAAIQSVIQKIPLASISRDPSIQPRTEQSQETIDDYARLMAGGYVFPPVVIVQDGVMCLLVDGFHRVAAAEKVGAVEIDAQVHTGSRRDALLLAVSANAENPLQRTNADKRRVVERLLRDPEWAQWNDSEIARRCRVSQEFVASIRTELLRQGHELPEKRMVRRNGKEYAMDVGGITAAQEKRKAGKDADCPTSLPVATQAVTPAVISAPTSDRTGGQDLRLHLVLNEGGACIIIEDSPGRGTFDPVAQLRRMGAGRCWHEEIRDFPTHDFHGVSDSAERIRKRAHAELSGAGNSTGQPTDVPFRLDDME